MSVMQKSTAPFATKVLVAQTSAALAASQGAGLVGYVGEGAGAVATNMLDVLRSQEVNVRRFGAKGDNVTNDAPAFQAAINYCQANRKALYIPDGNYKLDARLVVTMAFDIRSDATARMRWTSSPCGWYLDFNATVGLCRMDFPQLYGPAVDSGFNIPGYVPGAYAYDLASRAGTGIRLRAGDRTTITAQTIQGFYTGFFIEPGTTRSSNNVDFIVNTIDFCIRGMWAEANTTHGINALCAVANTVWARNPIQCTAVTGFITSSRFAINGQCFVNELTGCGVYGHGTRIDTCTFDINWLYAGYGSDSTAGTPETLQCPYIGGNGFSNGVAYDGFTTDVGYFQGNFCEFNIGAVMGIPGGKGAGSVPNAGDVIRVRDAGRYNKINVGYSNLVASVPLEVKSARGEANFNGGVGGAPYSKLVYCRIVLPALQPGYASADFYAYHQCLSVGCFRPIKVIAQDEALNNQGLLVSARDMAMAGAANREIKIVVNNPNTGRATAAGTYHFWLELP